MADSRTTGEEGDSGGGDPEAVALVDPEAGGVEVALTRMTASAAADPA